MEQDEGPVQASAPAVQQEYDAGAATDNENAPLLGAQPAAATPSLASARRRGAGQPTQAQGHTSRPLASGVDRLRSLTQQLPRSISYRPESLRKILPKLLMVMLAIVLLFILILLARVGSDSSITVTPPGISSASFHTGLQKCHAFRASLTATTASPTAQGGQELRTNPRYDASTAPAKHVLLHDGILLDPVDGERRADILLANGIIVEINATLSGLNMDVLRAQLRHLEPLEIVN
ncbi:hypothetical protein THASP1DRAFT_26443, partial [Thamnocephalis sphaerospora]